MAHCVAHEGFTKKYLVKNCFEGSTSSLVLKLNVHMFFCASGSDVNITSICLILVDL